LGPETMHAPAPGETATSDMSAAADSLGVAQAMAHAVAQKTPHLLAREAAHEDAPEVVDSECPAQVALHAASTVRASSSCVIRGGMRDASASSERRPDLLSQSGWFSHRSVAAEQDPKS
jgi:hypothetical protein